MAKYAALVGISVLLGMMTPTMAALPPLEPHVTLLDMHPIDPATNGASGGKPTLRVLPQINRPDHGGSPDASQIVIPPPREAPAGENTDLTPTADLGGSGFFIGPDGTVMTAAHVTEGCARLQILSDYVPRSWVSVAAIDAGRDLAILRVPGVRSPAVLRIGTVAPGVGKLRVAGYPGASGVVAWSQPINQKFPASVGSMANPRDLLWLSAPGVTRGFSGGPIFDPKSGTVVGVLKGTVDGGYLRLIRGIPTTGVVIGPGVGEMAQFLRREGSGIGIALAAASGETSDETLRRATVRVMCWR